MTRDASASEIAKVIKVIQKDEAAARSAIMFTQAHIGCMMHAIAVSECSKCNIGFVASRLLEILDAAGHIDLSALLTTGEAHQQREQDQEEKEVETRVVERTNSPLPVTTAGENEPIPSTASDDQVSNEPSLLHETKALNPWRPETEPLSLALLGKLAEEANELGAALARCVIQGIGESEPVTGKPNVDWLEDEMADVSGAGSLVIEYFGLREKRMNARFDRKVKHLRAWHALIMAGDGNQQPSGLRGDPGVDRTTDGEARDHESFPPSSSPVTPHHGSEEPDLVCKHGQAMDVHCCNCHSGFIFDLAHECPSSLAAVLHEIGVMAMTAQSDPYAEARTYRQALIDICNVALKAQAADPSSPTSTPDQGGQKP